MAYRRGTTAFLFWTSKGVPTAASMGCMAQLLQQVWVLLLYAAPVTAERVQGVQHTSTPDDKQCQFSNP